MSVPLEPDGSRLEAAAAGLRQEAADGPGHVVADPNAGVVRADPPGRGALLLAAAVAALTIAALVLLALAVGRAG